VVAASWAALDLQTGCCLAAVAVASTTTTAPSIAPAVWVALQLGADCGCEQSCRWVALQLPNRGAAAQVRGAAANDVEPRGQERQVLEAEVRQIAAVWEAEVRQILGAVEENRRLDRQDQPTMASAAAEEHLQD